MYVNLNMDILICHQLNISFYKGNELEIKLFFSLMSGPFQTLKLMAGNFHTHS